MGTGVVVGDEPPRVYDADDAAQALGLSRAALLRLVRDKRIGAVKVGPRSVRFTDEQLTEARGFLHGHPEELGYSVDQVAQILGVARSQVYRLLASGALLSVKVSYRGRRIVRPDQLRAYLDSRAAPS